MSLKIAEYASRAHNKERAMRYAQRFERGSRQHIDQREQRAVRAIFSGLTDCRSVLDVPCGTGRFLAALSENGRAVTEMDISKEFLELAEERAGKLSLQATFIQGNAAEIPLPAESVDVVFSNRLLHHLSLPDERMTIFKELRRVSRRHAVVSFFDYRAFGALRKFFKAIRGRKPTYAGQPTLEEFRDEVSRCGFQVREIVPTGPFWVSQKYFVMTKV